MFRSRNMNGVCFEISDETEDELEGHNVVAPISYRGRVSLPMWRGVLALCTSHVQLFHL